MMKMGLLWLLLHLLTKKKNLKETKLIKLSPSEKKLLKMRLKLDLRKLFFDRNGYLYHGRIKAFADSARENGLKF